MSKKTIRKKAEDKALLEVYFQQLDDTIIAHEIPKYVPLDSEIINLERFYKVLSVSNQLFKTCNLIVSQISETV